SVRAALIRSSLRSWRVVVEMYSFVSPFDRGASPPTGRPQVPGAGTSPLGALELHVSGPQPARQPVERGYGHVWSLGSHEFDRLRIEIRGGTSGVARQDPCCCPERFSNPLACTVNAVVANALRVGLVPLEDDDHSLCGIEFVGNCCPAVVTLAIIV